MRRLAAAGLVTLTALTTAPGRAQSTGSPAPRGRLAERIQEIIDRPEFRHATFGIELYALDTEQPIYTLNGDRFFVPGSTTKLVTEGTALALLGADYRFHTRLYRTGPIAPDGTLDGDLVLVASGDPNLSGRIRPDGTLAFENQDHSYDGSPDTRAVPGDPLLVLRELARRVRERGITRVRGRVLVDVSLFPEGERELGTGVVISPIAVNDNLVDVTIGPGPTPGAPVTIRVSPATSYVRFVNQATTGPAGSRPRIRWGSDVAAPDGSRTVTVVGSFPAGTRPILYSYAVPQPSRFAEVLLTELLRERGVRVESKSSAPPDSSVLRASYTPANLVAEHVSPPLSEEIKVTLKVSQNLHASMMPYILGAVVAHRGDAAAGFAEEREMLRRMGLDVASASQSDGAGGSAHFTPDFMVRFLAAMAKRADFEVFRAALPILGRDGTLWNVQVDSPAAGHVQAKTGTYVRDDLLNGRMMVDGKGLAGYLTTADGRPLAFAIYANNVPVSTDPDAITATVGQALGAIAAVAYEERP